MKRKITKAEFEALSAELKAFYKVDGDAYTLIVVGDGGSDDDPGELRRALERVRAEVATTKAALVAAEAKLNDDATIDARKKGDIVALEASWNTKLSTQKTTLETKIAELNKQVNKLLVENVANSMAAEIAGENAELIQPVIAARLTVEYDGDTPKTRVLDVDGKPSAATVAELKKEIVANKKYSVIIIASNASGGADTGSKGKNNSNGGAGGDKKFNELTEAERIEWNKRDPQGFKAAADGYKASLRR